MTVNVDFSKMPYPKERRLALYRQFLDTLSSLPGVVSLAQTVITPVSGNTWNNLVAPDAAAASATESPPISISLARATSGQWAHR